MIAAVKLRQCACVDTMAVRTTCALKRNYMRQLIALFLSVLFFAPTAFAGSTGYFTIHEIRTGLSSNDVFYIYGDFSSVSDTCSTNDNILLVDIDDATNVNYDGMVKLLTSALLAGKKVNAVWTNENCINGYVSLRQVYVCSDSSC